ncbi:hypothetical protein PR048_026043 [Dryococelus australis]|uniref:Uncharacterized protein n=1 Tax=Dryococelus australis TaxID=614101 RepID=A0ABQ9GKB1_9NEOP|nr:hypothetical protein PR048_026043 [Dryococelus australis]
MRVIEVNMVVHRNERGGREREIPEKTRRPTALSGTISTRDNPLTFDVYYMYRFVHRRAGQDPKVSSEELGSFAYCPLLHPEHHHDNVTPTSHDAHQGTFPLRERRRRFQKTTTKLYKRLVFFPARGRRTRDVVREGIAVPLCRTASPARHPSYRGGMAENRKGRGSIHRCSFHPSHPPTNPFTSLTLALLFDVTRTAWGHLVKLDWVNQAACHPNTSVRLIYLVAPLKGKEWWGEEITLWSSRTFLTKDTIGSAEFVNKKPDIGPCWWFFSISSTVQLMNVLEFIATKLLRKSWAILSSIESISSLIKTPSRATVAERLDCSPPTRASRVKSPAGSLRDFSSRNRAGRCRWPAGFLRGSPVSPSPFSIRRRSTLTSLRPPSAPKT